MRATVRPLRDIPNKMGISFMSGRAGAVRMGEQNSKYACVNCNVIYNQTMSHLYMRMVKLTLYRVFFYPGIHCTIYRGTLKTFGSGWFSITMSIFVEYIVGKLWLAAINSALQIKWW